ncbi:hypothetical protein [Evansella cellulosilytica]|uniref:Uncharacterized protein n=1 Tax=Evansella cellulosilytica (strain ATCC 21833 / DSM 2522 / FERM P-1141 / JCM 9156 / N-4) TaxID=649639 RepID=E6TZS8_EVAC2|nr:hypothetical protein [Evansella cellulosilytica]ADU31384.1 hypothetical protein Bcell_3141 [Evansella cellulosilytica DSM 2522]
MADMHEKNTKNKAIERGRQSNKRTERENAPGYGDKKLDGPNRPSE